MKILVLGASQGTGALAVRVAIERGHDVTAFSRNPDKLALANANLAKRAGNFHDRDSVDQAVRGHDAIIVTASATSFRAFKDKPHYFSEGTAYTIDAMKAHGVRRLVVLSALGSGDSRRIMGIFFDKIVVSFLLKAPFADHDRQEQMVRESGLDWVIARPARLTNGPLAKRYVATAELKRVPASISRADVADFLVTAAETDAWVRKAVQLGG
ncbi:MAG TPA: NAD(P)H-binding protein [Polyangiaceae bacterium]|jgi:uncharacterized protein YbjT (DUF2867 family)|nr:NAD(P)H-binding protein [Polyangiaceae bacterium]